MKSAIIVVLVGVSSLGGIVPTVLAQGFVAYDSLETIGADSTVVTTRVIAGITVTMTSGIPLIAETYGTGPLGFTGAGGAVNTPLNAANVSGTRFLTTNFNPDGGFTTAQPITFTFSQPVIFFGLTTLDILETAELSGNSVTLMGGLDTDTKMAPQGASGIDVDWVVTDPAGFMTATLSGGPLSQNGFGIDDLCLAPLVGAATGIGNDTPDIRATRALLQNHPNPFNPVTTIRFTLAKAGRVSISIYNVAGVKVASLLDGHKEAGAHSTQFDASSLASGVYFYQVSMLGVVQTGKMVVLK